MSIECYKLFNKLHFDKMELEGSKAQKFFKDNKNTFGKENADFVTDTLGNKIFSNVFDNKKYKWTEIDDKYKREFFTKLSGEIKKNIQLISEIEYFVRGIQIPDTKNHLLNIIEVCDAIANMLPIPSKHYLYCNEEKNASFHTYYMTNTSTNLLLCHVLYSLAALRPVKVFADNNTAVLIHLFQSLIKNCDVEGFLSNIGPYFNLKENNVLDELPVNGTTMIVCKSGDLDSAVDTVIKGVWSFRGLLPYRIRRILVQDNVWDEFHNKLSDKLKEFKWNFPQVYKPDSQTLEMIKHVNNIMEKSVANGQTILKMNDFFYESVNNTTHLKPLIILNEEPYFWQNLPKNIPVPVVTLQSFRTCKEALSLLDKVPMDYLTLWCNNISICNEISMKVNKKWAWINSFGHFNFNLVAVERIYNRLSSPSTPEKCVAVTFISDYDWPKKEFALKRVADISKQWLTLSMEKRISVLHEIVEYFEADKYRILSENVNMPTEPNSYSSSISEDGFGQDILNSKTLLHSYTSFSNISKGVNYICTQSKVPIGLVYIINDAIYNGTLSSIFAALLCGNAVLYEAVNDFSISLGKIFEKFNVPFVLVHPKDMTSFNLEATYHGNSVFSDFKFASNVFTNSNYLWCTFGESFYDAKTLNVTS